MSPVSGRLEQIQRDIEFCRRGTGELEELIERVRLCETIIVTDEQQGGLDVRPEAIDVPERS